MSGWVKAWRKELKSDIWQMSPLYHRVFTWLRYKAEHKETLFPSKKRFGIWLLPGQLITSLSLIAAGVSWTEWGAEHTPHKKTIRDILEWLKWQNMIKIESNDYGTFINIVNWVTYQGHQEEESNDLGIRRERDVNAICTHPKKYKKEEEVKENKASYSRPPKQEQGERLTPLQMFHRLKNKLPNSYETETLAEIAKIWREEPDRVGEAFEKAGRAGADLRYVVAVLEDKQTGKANPNWLDDWANEKGE